MKNRIGIFFFMSVLAGLVIGATLLISHLLLPLDKLAGVTQDVYRALIVKWFISGVALGMGIMFFLIESWIWKNWRIWNRFCCAHHERIYKSTMGISQGPMLRR